MSIENRLTVEQLAELAPGDAVTIERSTGVTRPRLTAGTVMRVRTSEVVVSVTGPRGGKFVERYSRRDARRLSGGALAAELVNPAKRGAGQGQGNRPIDTLYWAWRRNPHDAEALRRLHDVIGEYLAEVSASR